jgi:streptogramin lyase
MRKSHLALVVLLATASVAVWANNAADIPEDLVLSGVTVDQNGEPVSGATVTAFDDVHMKSTSVHSRADGSFSIAGLASDREYRLRSRLIGLDDAWAEPTAPEGTKLVMKPAIDMQAQRPAHHLLNLLEFDNEADALNFKMMCTYCHQVGTLGFRSPEEPVDWEVMITRMDGFRGLYEHTQKGLVDRLVLTYGREAEQEWPAYTPPPAPSGAALDFEITEWQMGNENYASIHDLEIGKDGLAYAVDMANDAVHTLDPISGERKTYSIPGGKVFGEAEPPIKGPHSIEMAANGDMWITLALSGEMAKLDFETREYTVVSGHEAPRKRGGYPHTLRIDQEGTIWWTDAALGVFSIHPETYDVKFYKLPSANQVRGTGASGESRGIVPYGLDIAPDGKVWYTKLNGQRVGVIDPKAPDGSKDQIIEWKPPVHGPRRLHVAPDGIVWVPGFASGDFASFDPATEEWKVYALPAGPDALPYALNIHPTTGEIWITGTGTDSMVRFDPKTEAFTEIRMPTRVTYTREVEFDAEGNIWTCNSNGPTRHIENRHGSLIKIAAN